MKYLTDYIQDAQTELFDRMGVFFAFSNEQFNKSKKEGVEYISLGAGTICPKANKNAFLKEHSEIVDAGIAKDLAENGKDGVIDRELGNHECYYTGDVSDCVRALEDYKITEEEIREVYNRERNVSQR